MLKILLSSDGSGTKNTGLGQAQALKVRLEPFHESGLRPFTILQIYYFLNKMLRFSGPFWAWALLQKSGSRPSKNIGRLWPRPGINHYFS